MKTDYPCPSCGFLVFSESLGSYAICPICNWEDDHVQLAYPGLRGGANGASLKDYQDIILVKIPVEILEYNGYKRFPNWRPLRQEECINPSEKGGGVEYFQKASHTEAHYYWDQ
jgi:hypothetical protein